MIEEIIPKRQFPEEFRRCFKDTETQIDFVVWYDFATSDKITGIQIEGIGSKILDFKEHQNGKIYCHKYNRDGGGETTKDFLEETQEKVGKENIESKLHIFDFDKNIALFVQKSLLSIKPNF